MESYVEHLFYSMILNIDKFQLSIPNVVIFVVVIVEHNCTIVTINFQGSMNSPNDVHDCDKVIQSN